MRMGVVGAAGRMGLALVREITAGEGSVLAAATERPGAAAIGRDAGELAGIGTLGVKIGEDPQQLFANVDAVLDFTRPEATRHHAALAAAAGVVHVIGTTGLEAADLEAIARAAQRTAIVQSANMSLGVTLLLELTRQAAARLDADFDIEILEMHHRMKVDAPSGTALALGAAAAEGRGVVLRDVSARGRDGITGARRRGDIGFAALRGGNVVGDHTVILAADNERIELTHKASDRAIFARGAVRAALWARRQGPGLYNMADVLGFGR